MSPISSAEVVGPALGPSPAADASAVCSCRSSGGSSLLPRALCLAVAPADLCPRLLRGKWLRPRWLHLSGRSVPAVYFSSTGARLGSAVVSRSGWICCALLPVLVCTTTSQVLSRSHVFQRPGWCSRSLRATRTVEQGLGRGSTRKIWSLTKLRYHANAGLNTVGCVLGSKQVGYNHCGAAALFLLDSSVVATKRAADSQPKHALATKLVFTLCDWCETSRFSLCTLPHLHNDLLPPCFYNYS